MGMESSLDNSVEEVEEDIIERGLDEVVVVETRATCVEGDVSLNRKEVFSDEMLEVCEMGFKAN